MTTSGSPVAGGSQQVNVRQNEPFAIDLLKATDVAYAKAQRWEFARAVVALSLSAGSLAAAIVRDLAPMMTVIGLGGAVAQWLMGYIGQSGSIFAAKLQERLDTYLFGLTMTAEFKPLPSDEEVAELAGRYHGSHTKRDWYVDVTSLPRPYAILLCQRENLQWDWPLRRKWASLLRGAAITWILVGLTIALVIDWSTRELLFRWLAPSLPALLLAGTLVVANRRIAREKQQMAIEVDEELGALPAIRVGETLTRSETERLLALCRRYQDQLYRLRSPSERVPQRVYNWSRKKQQKSARATAARLRARLLDDDISEASTS